MNPKDWCAAHDVTTRDFVERVRQIAPKYSKVTHSMASNTDYGVTLSPAVVRHIKGKPENRRLPCRISFRLSEGVMASLTALRDAEGFATNQDYMTHIVLQHIKRAAAPGGTETTANKNSSP